MSDSRRRAQADRRTSDRFGGDTRSLLAGLVRLAVFVLVVGAIALGVTLVAPGALDDLQGAPIDGPFTGPTELPPPSGDPPPAGDRTPAVTHPDDPTESAYNTEVETVSSDAVEDFVHAGVNERRAEEGLDPIEWDGTIASVSRAHSHDMAAQDYFDHQNRAGENPHDRFHAVADYCQRYGENLALNRLETPIETPDGEDVTQYRTAEEIAAALVDQWLHSPAHREAMLDDGWDRGGVGVYVTDEGAVYATHNFCTDR